MKHASCRFAVPIAVCLLAAACGSSSSSRSAPAASGSAGASSGSGYGGGSSQTPANTASTKVVAKHSKLGQILAAGPKKLTVYVFSADSGSTSHCTGACAKVWPAVPAVGTPTGIPPAQSSLISTTTGAAGAKQLTYKGQPVYYFAKDKDDGDTYGQGIKHFGGSWYVLKPNGSKLDNS